MIKNIFAVGLGGCVGSVLRYLVHCSSIRLSMLLGGFPIATLIVNAIGSLLFGVLFEIFFIRGNGLPKTVELFLFVGILGGFTTFSAFSKETHVLFTQGEVLTAYLNILTNLTVCISAVYLGHIIGGFLK